MAIILSKQNLVYIAVRAQQIKIYFHKNKMLQIVCGLVFFYFFVIAGIEFFCRKK